MTLVYMLSVFGKGYAIAVIHRPHMPSIEKGRV